jgi:hypothetical protein
MPATWEHVRPALHQALEGQGFRQVPLDELVAAPFHLPTSGGEIDAALAQVTADPNWIEITRQLAQLRTPNGAFVGLHLRRDSYDLELVPIYAWKGELSRDTVVSCLEWVYTCTYRISKVLGDFDLPDAASSALEEATKNLPAAGKAVVQAIVDLNVAKMPNTTLLVVDTDGFTDQLVQELDTLPMSKSTPNPLSIGNRPVVFVAGVDARRASVHGHNDWASLDLPALNRNLPFLAGA